MKMLYHVQSLYGHTISHIAFLKTKNERKIGVV